jgi:hypothetical protein
MINVPASIMSALDKIALRNDLEQEFIINSVTPSEPQVFNVTVVAGSPPETGNASEGTAHGNPKLNNSQSPSYYFVRVRREFVDEKEKPDPFLATNKKMARKLANMHPIGVLMAGQGSRAPMTGEVWSARYLTKDRSGIILKERVGLSSNFTSLSEKDSVYQSAASSWSSENPQLLGSPPQQSPKSSDDYSNEYGLKPKRGIYNGSYLPKGTEVLNGYPNYSAELLQVPDTRFWKLKGGGTGALLKDFIGSFNKMTEHFYKDFGKKFLSSGIRDFDTQMAVRRNSVKKGNCANMTISGCSTAVPGSSNHGWGQAVDIKSVTRHTKLKWSDPEYEWMVKNAATYNWHHPSWAQIDGSEPEPWHWEPLNKVIAVQ